MTAQVLQCAECRKPKFFVYVNEGVIEAVCAECGSWARPSEDLTRERSKERWARKFKQGLAALKSDGPKAAETPGESDAAADLQQVYDEAWSVLPQFEEPIPDAYEPKHWRDGLDKTWQEKAGLR